MKIKWVFIQNECSFHHNSQMNAENVVKDFSQPHIGGREKKLMNDNSHVFGIVSCIWYPVVVLYLLFGWV